MNKLLLFNFLFFSSLIGYSQTADFTFQSANGLFCRPASVQFTSTATGTPRGYLWNFGNGIISSQKNPATTYSNAGTYTVRLIVIYQKNTVTVSKTIAINPSITATIKYDRNYICQPGNINFSATSTGDIAAYEWNFGDGSGPVSTPTNSVAHTFGAFGDYNITLKATDVSGCYATATASISVKQPTVRGTVSPTSGCIPATVSFTASAVIPVNSTVSSYTWNFGDGSPGLVTTSNSASHIYTTTGSYTPTVTITTNEGCTNTYPYSKIAFGTPPYNHIAYPIKTVICGSETASFVSKATTANSYFWDFGDGSTATVTDTITQHKYKTLGLKNVTVTPAFNGCMGTPITFQIDVIGVIASYNFSNTCAGRNTFSFNNTSQGNLSAITWDFGDTTPVIRTLNASHAFPLSGEFVTRLSETDSITGCSDVFSQTVYTAKPSLVNSDAAICRNSSTSFSILDNYDNPSATYTWNVVGKQEGPFNAADTTIAATIFGNFNNFVAINNGAQYCPDTIRLDHKILVRGPDLNFTAPSSLCFDTSYAVTNFSKPYIPTDSVTLWYWNFGAMSANDTSYQPQPFTYPGPGKYKVKLDAVDVNGCEDSLIKPITINSLPFLQLIPLYDTLCAGTPDSLFAFHSDDIIWSPSGSLSCATCDTVVANPTSSTIYRVTATSRFGCTSTDSIPVTVFPPFVATASDRDAYICQNDTITLKIDPPTKEIVWSPADGLSSSTSYNPVASPLQTTTYTATLIDSAGCFSSTTDINVHVKSLPVVDAGPDSTVPFNSNFSLDPTYSSNIASYAWTPSTLLTCGSCASPKGLASYTETYGIKVTSDSGCTAKDEITIFVECKNANILMPNAFTPNKDFINDYYYPLTRGIKSIVRFSIYDRYGKLVYEARNFPPNMKSYGWDGRTKNADQSTSVFVYYIEALCDVGQKLYTKGSFVLLR